MFLSLLLLRPFHYIYRFFLSFSLLSVSYLSRFFFSLSSPFSLFLFTLLA